MISKTPLFGALTLAVLATAPVHGKDVKNPNLSKRTDASRYRLSAVDGEAKNRATALARIRQTLEVVRPEDVPGERQVGYSLRKGIQGKKTSKIKHTDDQLGFQLSDEDTRSKYFVPSGITGSADASSSGRVGGRRLIVTLDRYDRSSGGSDEGDHLKIIDITNMSDIRYRRVALVDPFLQGSKGSFRRINLSASGGGGIAWVGRYLFVADTFVGLRVFDMQQILVLNAQAWGIGLHTSQGRDLYRAYDKLFAVPQVRVYKTDASGGRKALCSFVSLDRTSYPPALITGETRSYDTSGLLLRFPLYGDLPRSRGGTVQATEVYTSNHRDMRGAVCLKRNSDRFFLSCPDQKKRLGTNLGILFQTGDGFHGPSKTFEWGLIPRDLYNENGRLWGLTSKRKKRFIFSRSVN